jgi:PleD family two-component response regulator
MPDKSNPSPKKSDSSPEDDIDNIEEIEGTEESQEIQNVDEPEETPEPKKAAEKTVEKPAKKPAAKPKAKAKAEVEEEIEGEESEGTPGPEFLVVEDEDGIDTTLIPTDTSERFILVVDEEGHRRNETVTIITKILPNAVVEVADDPEEASDLMSDCDFDTFVVNFLMPGYSASPFVKAVANHPDHPLLIGFAADKISDALDPKKGLKIIPLKRLFDLDTSANPDGDGD